MLLAAQSWHLPQIRIIEFIRRLRHPGDPHLIREHLSRRITEMYGQTLSMMAHLWTQIRLRIHPLPIFRPKDGYKLATMLLVLISVIVSLIADSGARTPATRPTAQWWWVGSMGLLLIAVLLRGFPARKPRQQTEIGSPPLLVAESVLPGTPQQSHKDVTEHQGAISRKGESSHTIAYLWGNYGDGLLIAALITGALVLRLPDLAAVPYIIHGDEAQCGLEALRWLHGNVPSLLSTGWFGLPVLGYGIPAVTMRVFGSDLFGLRLSSVIIGTLTIPLLYLLVREFAARRMAFIAAGLLATTHSHIHFSRIGLHNVHAPFVATLTLWLFVRALRLQSALLAVLAGVGLSLCMQVYWGARIVLLIIPAFILSLIVLHRRLLRGRLATIGWLVLGACIALGPLLVFLHADAAMTVDRTSAVYIVNPTQDVRLHLISQFGTADLRTVLLRNLATLPLTVGGLADQSLQYGPNFPMFDALMAALITIGFFYALLRLRHPLCLLLLLWLGSGLAGGVLTVDAPWWPRLLVILPALCILAALALESVLRVLEPLGELLAVRVFQFVRQPRQLAALMGTLLALGALTYSVTQSYQHYFHTYASVANSSAGRTNYTDIARFAAQQPDNIHTILFSDQSLNWNYGTIQYLAPSIAGKTTDTAEGLRALLAVNTAHLVVIIMPNKQQDFTMLLMDTGAVPPGRLDEHLGATGNLVFMTYTITYSNNSTSKRWSTPRTIGFA